MWKIFPIFALVGCSSLELYPCEYRSTYIVEGPERAIPQMRCADFVFIEPKQIQGTYDVVSYNNNNDIVIHRVDPFGNTRYDRNYEVIRGTRIYKVDPFGNTQYQKSYKELD